MNKIIYLARHAKSSWSTGASDFERPLSKRGYADSERIGEELNRLNWKPEKIISSPALRASQTCQAYCDAIKFPHAEIDWEKDFYAAYTVTLLHTITSLDEGIQSVMLVGHNPSMEDLLLHLCSEASVSKIKQANGKLFTTGNIMTLAFSGNWKDLMADEAELVSVLRPKEL